MTATLSGTNNDKTHRETRAGLQQELKDREKIKAELDSAAARLKEAQRLVAEFERPLGYADQPLRDWLDRANRFNRLDNEIPQQLLNSCRDAELRADWDDAMGAKRTATREREAALELNRDATQSFENMQSRLTQGCDGARAYGPPAILKDGESPPWAATAIGQLVDKLASTFSGNRDVLWAIRGDVIAFRPGAVGAADTERDLIRDWSTRSRDVRRAAAALTAVDERLKTAKEALEAARHRLIWSPV